MKFRRIEVFNFPANCGAPVWICRTSNIFSSGPITAARTSALEGAGANSLRIRGGFDHREYNSHQTGPQLNRSREPGHRKVEVDLIPLLASFRFNDQSGSMLTRQKLHHGRAPNPNTDLRPGGACWACAYVLEPKEGADIKAPVNLAAREAASDACCNPAAATAKGFGALGT